MIEPKLYDVIEILYPLSAENLPAGAQGTLVHQHEANVFEVEFVNEAGETIALCSLSRHQFIVIWQAATEQPVSVAEQVAQVVALLPGQAGSEVLDFAWFLSQRQRQEQSKSVIASVE
jgi:hypothetical protein